MMSNNTRDGHYTMTTAAMEVFVRGRDQIRGHSHSVFDGDD